MGFESVTHKTKTSGGRPFHNHSKFPILGGERMTLVNLLLVGFMASYFLGIATGIVGLKRK